MNEHRRSFLRNSCLAAAGFAQAAEVFAAAAGEPAVAPRQLPPPDLQADVLVLGAGASGIPAAIAAARAGARVILVEEDATPGGAPVDMSVAMLCGWPRVGIFREMVDMLQNHHHLMGRPVRPEEETRDTWFLPTSYLQVLGRMLAAEQNLQLICGARATAPVVNDREERPRVEGVLIAGPGFRERRIQARVTIDCTGSGAIAEMAGCRSLYGRDARSNFSEPHARPKADTQVMPCTWMYVSQRFRSDPDRPLDFDMLQSKGANESGYGWFTADRDAFHRRNTGIYLHWGVTVLCKDTRDPVELAQAQQEAWTRLQPDMQTLFAQGFAVHLPPRLGVRECRRIVGEHVLSENDLRSGKHPEDVVATGRYYLDIWGEKLTEEEKKLPEFGIPYRCLVPRGVEGLLVAGKIISGTHVAMSAYRVQPIVAGIGQAAGTAAAMVATGPGRVRDVDLGRLQERLRAGGLPI